MRGSLEETLEDLITGSIPEDDNRLMKFHGSYMQDDRDLRNERQKQKLEPAYQFMLRVRAAGGIVTPEQWLMMDRVAQKYANGSIRLTTRQSFQLHGVLKWNLKKTIREVNDALLSTLAACGDVNRNVMCNPNPYQSEVHAEVYEWASRVSDHLDPRTSAYHEIWLDGEKVVDSQEDEVEQEPIYGPVICRVSSKSVWRYRLPMMWMYSPRIWASLPFLKKVSCRDSMSPLAAGWG